MSAVVVFVGPTLSAAEVGLHLDANVLPPARQGDVLRAVREGARAIGLVDGLFDRVPAVWHKEILYALSQGVRVFGAASMGALRAAELHSFGMEGVGEIFAAYRDGALSDDDEVAVAHGPAESGWRPLSEAMVNLRHGLRLAEEAGAISAATHAALRARAKATHYSQRSWPGLLRAAGELGVSEDEQAGLRALLARVRPSRKRDDAVLMLRAMAAAGAESMPPHVPAFQFEPTVFWESLAHGTGEAETPETTAPRDAALLRHLLLTPAGDRARREALLWVLADAEARRLGHEPDARATAEAGQRMQAELGLVGRKALLAWLQEQGFDGPTVVALLRLEAEVEAAAQHHRGGVLSLALLAAQRRGELPALRRAAAEQQRRLAAAGHPEPTLDDTGLSREELLAWYVREVRPVGDDLLAHLRGLGFASLDAFITALSAMYLGRPDPRT